MTDVLVGPLRPSNRVRDRGNENRIAKRRGHARDDTLIRGDGERVFHHRVSQVDVRRSRRVRLFESHAKSVPVFRHRAFRRRVRRGPVRLTAVSVRFLDDCGYLSARTNNETVWNSQYRAATSNSPNSSKRRATSEPAAKRSSPLRTAGRPSTAKSARCAPKKSTRATWSFSTTRSSTW